ncbi:MAG: type II toxin-antitoxin system death-on-curing family toxin [Spirochaetota bacterium]
MRTWRGIGIDLVLAIHDRQLAEHGGLDEIRDRGLIESALAKPRNLAVYSQPDLADLAASYAFGLAKNHAFIDGNKRTAWVVARVFLADNGLSLQFDAADAIRTVESLAGGTLDESGLALWFRSHLAKGS